MIAVQAPGGIRDVAREAVRARVGTVAIDLFTEHGFDEVTIEQIADAVGISPRSFHRYFPAKEDVVIGDLTPYGLQVRDLFTQQPIDEPVWTALLHAYEALLATRSARDEHSRQLTRLLNSTPSLRARNLEKHLAWAELLTPIAEQRLGGPHARLQAATLVHASLTCFDLALAAWADSTTTNTPDELLRQSFATLNPSRR